MTPYRIGSSIQFCTCSGGGGRRIVLVAFRRAPWPSGSTVRGAFLSWSSRSEWTSRYRVAILGQLIGSEWLCRGVDCVDFLDFFFLNFFDGSICFFCCLTIFVITGKLNLEKNLNNINKIQ